MKESSISEAFRKAFDAYTINHNRMSRYAARRGVSDELSAYLDKVDSGRTAMFSLIRKYLSDKPVVKAWLFGSFARGEERDDSDIDILAEYDHDAGVSLLDVIRWKLDLEKITGRSIDWVEEGYLRPFAEVTARRDKYLIYERTN